METKKEGGTGTVLKLVVIGGLALWGYVYSGLGAEIATECSVNGGGLGQCTFTNTGWTADSICPWVGLENPRNGVVMESQVCSGIVWPSDSVQKSYRLDRSGGHCKTLFGGLAQHCQVVISLEPRAAGGQGPANATGDDGQGADTNSQTQTHQAEATPAPQARGRGYGNDLPYGFFKPLKAMGQFSPMHCRDGSCTHIRWSMVRELKQEGDALILEADVTLGWTEHETTDANGEQVYPDYPESTEAAGSTVTWDLEVSTWTIVCSKTKPMMDGRAPHLVPGMVPSSNELEIRRYLEACHSDFGDPEQAISRYGYNVQV